MQQQSWGPGHTHSACMDDPQGIVRILNQVPHPQLRPPQQDSYGNLIPEIVPPSHQQSLLLAMPPHLQQPHQHQHQHQPQPQQQSLIQMSSLQPQQQQQQVRVIGLPGGRYAVVDPGQGQGQGGHEEALPALLPTSMMQQRQQRQQQQQQQQSLLLAYPGQLPFGAVLGQGQGQGQSFHRAF